MWNRILQDVPKLQHLLWPHCKNCIWQQAVMLCLRGWSLTDKLYSWLKPLQMHQLGHMVEEVHFHHSWCQHSCWLKNNSNMSIINHFTAAKITTMVSNSKTHSSWDMHFANAYPLLMHTCRIPPMLHMEHGWDSTKFTVLVTVFSTRLHQKAWNLPWGIANIA